MTTTAPTDANPTQLENTREQIEQWRKARPHGNTPMPAALWTAAVAAAQQHGLYPSARLLRLDYGALKAHVEASRHTRLKRQPTFVELAPPRAAASGAIECVIEIEGRHVTRRLRLNGLAPGDLPALLRMAWGASR